MTKTLEDLEKLKAQWKSDPCWDLAETPGFEEFRDELVAFQALCEAEWEVERTKKERALDEKARSLGVEGLYRLILEHQTLLDRHNRALSALLDGDEKKAREILLGIDF